MNVLKKEKELLVSSLLCESTSIRSIERLTGVHRDTVLRVLLRFGEKCRHVLDSHMRDLCVNALEIDEAWGFVAKKERSLKPDDPVTFGDAYVFVAQCPETKIVPHFVVGKRNDETTWRFVEELSKRVAWPCQVSTDGFRSYRTAVPANFGPSADFMQIIKNYHGNQPEDERRYSPAKFVGIDRVWVSGAPRLRFATTSHVEAQNAGLRTNVRRLGRLTRCFSRKIENLEAALYVHFATFNFMRKHRGIGDVPAVAAGLTDRAWTVERLAA